MTIVNTLLGTFSILLFNCVLAVAFTGIGLLLRRLFGLREADRSDCFFAFWSGFGCIILVLMLWNFFLPINSVCLGLVLITGIGAMVRELRNKGTHGSDLAAPSWSFAVAAIFSVWVANQSTGQMVAWDTSLYHMQGVAWAKAYPAVPGLANLFGPLGFNNSSFLYNAMLDVGPWSGGAWHVSLGVLVSVFGAQIMISAGCVLRHGIVKAQDHLLAAILMPLAVSYVLDGTVTSFRTDIPTAILIMVIVVRGYRLFCDKDGPANARAFDFFVMAGLGAVAVSMKLSAAIFAASTLALSCYGIWKLGGNTTKKLQRRAIRWCLVAVALVGLSWAGRGVILSGYALFPNQSLGIDVEWRAPAEHARAEFEYVAHSARATSQNFAYIAGDLEGLNAWILHWTKIVFGHPIDLVVPLALLILATLLFLTARKKADPSNRRSLATGWLIGIPICVSTLVWFIVAPMPHYGAPFVWSLLALVGCQAIRLRNPRPETTCRLVLGIFLLSVAPCFVGPFWPTEKTANSKPLIGRFLDYNFNKSDQASWLQSGVRKPKLATFTTDSGLVLNVPVGRMGRSWNAPIPCTPNPAPNLRLRKPGDLGSGFVVDGGWQMKNWPEAWRPRLLPTMRKRWVKEGAAETTK